MHTRLVDDLRRLGMLQPAAYSGQVVHAFTRGDRGHGAAIGVAANNDIGHPQYRDGILDCRRHATRMRAVGRHDIASVTNHEQFARFLLRQQFRYHAAIGAGDKQGAWVLRGCQVFEQVGALWERFALKLQKSVNKRLHRMYL